MTSTAQKKAIKKWRDTNREQYNEYQLQISKRYYENNREKVLEKKSKEYLLKKQCKIFMNILLEE